MGKNLKWFFRQHFTWIRLFNNKRLLCMSKNSYLVKTGWTMSIRRGYPSDANGEPVPWMNYAFIAFIKERLNPQMVLLEFGAGYSSIFWAKHVKQVFSVEHDPFFVNKLKNDLPQNVTLYSADEKSNSPYYQYAKVISEQQQGLRFDVIVIDGIERINCALHSVDYLTPTGVLIFDDSHRSGYRKAYQYLQEKGFKKLEFEGLKPGDRTVDRTAVFYRSQNCLHI